MSTELATAKLFLGARELKLKGCILRQGWRAYDTTGSAIYNRGGHKLHAVCSKLDLIQNCICFFFKMVRMCAFPGCFNRQKAVRLRPRALSPEERLTFHRFPLNDPERLRLWLLAVHRDTSLPIQSLDVLRLCSEHFSRDDFKSDEGNVRRYLKSTAVPVLFLKTEVSEENI